MNWAIGHGSSAGRWARSFGKYRMRALTSSLLHSQKVASNSRSSSGVSKSDEKMVVVVSMATEISGAGWRLQRWVFMAVPSHLRVILEPNSGESRSLTHAPRASNEPHKRRGEREKATA